jgi:hypothetical protein
MSAGNLRSVVRGLIALVVGLLLVDVMYGRRSAASPRVDRDLERGPGSATALAFGAWVARCAWKRLRASTTSHRVTS